MAWKISIADRQNGSKGTEPKEYKIKGDAIKRAEQLESEYPKTHSFGLSYPYRRFIVSVVK